MTAEHVGSQHHQEQSVIETPSPHFLYIPDTTRNSSVCLPCLKCKSLIICEPAYLWTTLNTTSLMDDL